jgi:prepilin-type N-terminal cleavage/methylation domain-containing protein
MNMNIKKKMKGFSVVELLIAVIIMGVLVAIIVPRLATRTELARKKAAMADLENIQNSLERAAIDTGHYYRIYVLNDVPGGDGIGWGDPNDIVDGVADEELNLSHNNGRQIFIDLDEGDFRPNYDTLYTLLASNETAFNWNGPYINWNKDEVDSDGAPIPDDIPDDPWGHNYLLFTSLGLVLEPDGIIQTGTHMGSDVEVFDRTTLLSLGPNGLPGDGVAGSRFGTGDDFVRQF